MQVESKLPIFADFSQILAQADSMANPAEIHGMLCGLICGGNKLNGNFWLNAVLKLFEVRAHLPTRHREIILTLYDETFRQLSGVSSEFYLLLPDINQPLPDRAHALSQWCQGFIAGLGLMDAEVAADASNELHENLHCLNEIAKLDFTQIDVKEELDQIAYISVVEYVRTTVVALYSEVIRQNAFIRVPLDTKINASLH